MFLLCWFVLVFCFVDEGVAEVFGEEYFGFVVDGYVIYGVGFVGRVV